MEVHSTLLSDLVVLIEDLANNFCGWIYMLEKFLLRDVKEENVRIIPGKNGRYSFM